MNAEQLVRMLDDRAAAQPWLADLRVEDTKEAHRHLVAIADLGLTLDLLAELFSQLAQHLPSVSSPDTALASLRAFIAASRSPLAFGSLIVQDHQALPVLLELFSASEMLGRALVHDPAAYDVVRLTEGQPASCESLTAEICGEVAKLRDARDVALALRNFKRRETLRIAYGDTIQDQAVDAVAQQLAYLATAICTAALQSTRHTMESKRGVPRTTAGQKARFVMLGLDRLGGLEMDYSPYLRALFVYDGEGKTDASKPIDNHDFFQELTRKTIDLLSDKSDEGLGYHIDIAGSPAALIGQSCLSLSSTAEHFETRGRTWERQSLVKLRPIAGDLELGEAFIARIEPWVYRRYLNRADLAGLKALKRRLERRSDESSSHHFDIERSVVAIESLVQFLQLINGGGVRALRQANTRVAIARLAEADCLTVEEATELQTHYDWLRRVEHRLETMRDPRVHQIPREKNELRKVALRCGYREQGREDIALAFQDKIDQHQRRNQELVHRLLDQTFPEDDATDPETDLVLDPAPDPESVERTLRPYHFLDPLAAHQSLCDLAKERIPFLSTRRCRHFLSQIARPLLTAVASTPGPSATLTQLCRVSDSIGGKGVLWELFSLHPPSLELYVRLCSSSPYLTSILLRYPGMIDELLDSLLLAELPTLGELQKTLDDLCQGVEDIEPILHSFKNTQHLNVGVRELLGHADVRDATATLADVAETCLQHIARDQHHRLVRRLGQPCIGNSERPCEPILVAMGKFGGREPNYHSDADVMFLYEAEGTTLFSGQQRSQEGTTNQHFFSELGQRTLRAISDHGAHGKLYDSNARLRPIGATGPMSVSLDVFRTHFLQDSRTWDEVRSLCQARPIHGSERVRSKAAAIIREILTYHSARNPFDAESVRQARHAIQASAGPRNLKRGPGGIVDVEFIVQLLQLRHAHEQPSLLRTNTFAALDTLERAGLLSAGDGAHLRTSYRFLRQVEACLRLMITTARHDLPRDPDELAKLAYLLRYDGPTKVEAECARLMKQNRLCFERIVG